jgi:NAD(P) transhydrogenase subunit beta
MRDLTTLTDALIILALFTGVGLFRSPRSARFGNLLAALALLAAMGLVVARHGLDRPGLVLGALAAGAGLGLAAALRVTMTQIPAMIAFQHGAGGLAALLISLLELWRAQEAALSGAQALAGLLGLVIGSATFTGSLLAAGRLSGLQPAVTVRPRVSAPALFFAACLLATASGFFEGPLLLAGLLGAAGFAAAGGLALAAPVGGADMPVLISLLNATAGFAAAFCGVILEDRLLVVAGATVAASGSVLTHVMCRSMNRSLLSLFAPRAAGAPATSDARAPDAQAAAGKTMPDRAQRAAAAASHSDPLEESVAACLAAQDIIVVPGYGMARAQAQFEVAALGAHLMEMGKDVRFAVHPVAGRMPGHMHVLLAEADVSYDLLVEMEQINPQFKDADLALVVGACDVVNPAALSVEGCPISGMPILLAGAAGRVLVCNFDDKPGYSGVENPLYEQPNTIMLLGDAKATIARLLEAVHERAGADSASVVG